MPDMPAPPMPTMCTRCSSSGRAMCRLPASGEFAFTGAPFGCPARRAPPRGRPRRPAARHRGGPPAPRPPSSPSAAAASPSSPATVSPTNSGVRSASSTRQSTAGIDDGQRVESLLAVADGQRHVHRGQPDGGDLGHRHRAGPADRQIGCGVGQVHPVQVRHGDVWRVAGLRARAGRGCSSGRARAAPRYPRRQASLAAAETARLIDCAPCEPPNTSSTRASSANPKCARAFAAQRHPVQRGDRRAHRHADHLGARQARDRAPRRAPGAPTGRRPCWPSPRWRWPRGRPPAPGARSAARRQVGGQRDVAAEADDDVGVDVVEHGAGLPDGAPHPQRQAQQVAAGLARQRHRRDELEVVAALGHQPGLQAALRCRAR